MLASGNMTSPPVLAVKGMIALGLTRMLGCAFAPNMQEGGEAGDQALLRAMVEGLPHLTHLTLVARTSEVISDVHDGIALRCTEVSAGRAHPGRTLCWSAESAVLDRRGGPMHGRSPCVPCRIMGMMLAPVTSGLSCRRISAARLVPGAAATRRRAGARQAGGADCDICLVEPRCCAPQACTTPAPLFMSLLPCVRACSNTLRSWCSQRP